MMPHVPSKPRKTNSGDIDIVELEDNLVMLSQDFYGPTCHIGRSISDWLMVIV